jgi:hypothetical protein
VQAFALERGGRGVEPGFQTATSDIGMVCYQPRDEHSAISG